MKQKPSLSFKTQLTLMMLIVLTVTLTAVISFTFLKINKDLTNSLINESVLQAKLLAFNSVLAVETANHHFAQKILEDLSHTSSINTAAITLTNNSLLASFRPPNNTLLLNYSHTKPLSISKTELLIVQPIYSGNKIIGYLHISHDLAHILSHESNYILIFSLIFLAILLMSFQLAKYFQTLMTRPISQMLNHLDNIYKANNFDKRLQVISDDEIGKLTLGFNNILDEVQKRENELTAQTQQLQKLVDVRTEQLNRKAHFDSLTNLPNRYLLVDRLHQAISNASRNKTIVALLFLDIDRFKVINDNLGHQNGDLLLKEVAKRLQELSRESDTVARLGGDEFVFLLENLNTPHDPARTAKRIINSFKKPFHIQEHILHVSTSIGISVYPSDGLNFEILLQNADISMYHAKNFGPGNFSFYNRNMNESSLERLKIESNLRTAIEKDEFYLVYQPQLSLKDNKCRNVEALLRWRNSDVGDISPGTFVPIAEETGMVNQIDLWVISEACKQIKLWNDIGIYDLTVAINISAGHLIGDSLLNHVKNQIELYDIDPKQIEIEITEAVFVKHTEPTIQTLKTFKQMGIRIAIDDFGTGYSSLQYIQDFPVDTLKLDGMFLADLENNQSGRGIVRSTIILAHSLGLDLVSECVENPYQLDFLREHQCDLVQGYLYSKPLSPVNLAEFYFL